VNGPRGAGNDDELERDLAAFGLRLEGEDEERSAAPEFGVWAENWDAVLLFAACDTQWRVAAGLGGAQVLGLDYRGVEVVMRYTAIKRADRAPLFRQLQVMERAAIEAMNGRRGD
jgi:hypothetical protein